MTVEGQGRRIRVADDGGGGELERLLGDALSGLGLEPGDPVPLEAVAEAARPGDLWIVLFDLQRVGAAIACQDSAVRSGAQVLSVGQEPGVIWLGPLAGPGRSGCLACLRTWVNNNRREPNHWSAARHGAQAAPRRAAAQRPLGPGVRAIASARFSALASAFLAEGEAFVPELARIDMQSLSCASHPLVAIPRCASCSSTPEDTAEAAEILFSPQPKARAEDSRIPNPLLTLDRARSAFLDRQTGLAKHLFQDTTSPLMPIFAAEMPIIGSDAVEKGFGRAETLERSQMIAILELIERFAGHEPRRTRTSVRGSYGEVRERFGEQCVDPAKFVLHRPEQRSEPGYRLADYDEDGLAFDWSWGFSARRRGPVLIPTQLVYYWLPESSARPTNRFVSDSSSGCAMGGSIEEAILQGLYELIERDAYLTSWFGRIVPREIDPSSIGEMRSRALLARAEAEGLEIRLFDMRLDIDIPAVWAMIVDPQEDAPVRSYCASAAHGDWGQAVFSALVEITTSMGVYRHTMPAERERAEALWNDGSLVQAMHDHVLLYSVPPALERMDFLFKGPTVTLDSCERERPSMRELDLTRELEAQLAKVLAVADDVIVVDQTFGEMAALGLKSVKVVAPGLTPVTFGHQYRRVGLDRVRHALQARGQGPERFGVEDLNPHPHNFP